MKHELRRDVLLPLIVLMALAAMTSIGSIALLVRMAPAIDRIVSENVFSLQATEEMLSILATAPQSEATAERFASALARAEGNVTETEEPAQLAIIHDGYRAALAGESAPRARVIAALMTLGEINRRATVERDQEAQFLGYAGAWTAVLLGTLSFAWGLVAAGRARRRIIEPLDEIGDVLIAARTGDKFRRCIRMQASREVERIMAGVDDLLDARALHYFAEQPALSEVTDRAVLLFLLDQRPRPAWIVCSDGSVEASNQAGLELLAGDGATGLRAELERAVRGEALEHLSTTEITGVAGRFLCELVAPCAFDGARE